MARYVVCQTRAAEWAYPLCTGPMRRKRNTASASDASVEGDVLDDGTGEGPAADFSVARPIRHFTGSTAVVSNKDTLTGASGYPGAVVNPARDFLIAFFAGIAPYASRSSTMAPSSASRSPACVPPLYLPCGPSAPVRALPLVNTCGRPRWGACAARQRTWTLTRTASSVRARARGSSATRWKSYTDASMHGVVLLACKKLNTLAARLFPDAAVCERARRAGVVCVPYAA